MDSQPTKSQKRLILTWMYGPINLLLLGISILILVAVGPIVERLSFIVFIAITGIAFSLILRKTLKPLVLPQSSNVKKLASESIFFGTFMMVFSLLNHERVSILSFLFLTIFFGLLYGPFALFQPPRPTLGVSSFRFLKRKNH